MFCDAIKIAATRKSKLTLSEFAYKNMTQRKILHEVESRINKGQLDIAISYLDRAIEKDPGNSAFLHKRGTIMALRNNEEDLTKTAFYFRAACWLWNGKINTDKDPDILKYYDSLSRYCLRTNKFDLCKAYKQEMDVINGQLSASEKAKYTSIEKCNELFTAAIDDFAKSTPNNLSLQILAYQLLDECVPSEAAQLKLKLANLQRLKTSLDIDKRMPAIRSIELEDFREQKAKDRKIPAKEKKRNKIIGTVLEMSQKIIRNIIERNKKYKYTSPQENMKAERDQLDLKTLGIGVPEDKSKPISSKIYGHKPAPVILEKQNKHLINKLINITQKKLQAIRKQKHEDEKEKLKKQQAEENERLKKIYAEQMKNDGSRIVKQFLSNLLNNEFELIKFNEVEKQTIEAEKQKEEKMIRKILRLTPFKRQELIKHVEEQEKAAEQAALQERLETEKRAEQAALQQRLEEEKQNKLAAEQAAQLKRWQEEKEQTAMLKRLEEAKQQIEADQAAMEKSLKEQKQRQPQQHIPHQTRSYFQ